MDNLFLMVNRGMTVRADCRVVRYLIFTCQANHIFIIIQYPLLAGNRFIQKAELISPAGNFRFYPFLLAYDLITHYNQLVFEKDHRAAVGKTGR